MYYMYPTNFKLVEVANSESDSGCVNATGAIIEVATVLNSQGFNLQLGDSRRRRTQLRLELSH